MVVEEQGVVYPGSAFEYWSESPKRRSGKFHKFHANNFAPLGFPRISQNEQLSKYSLTVGCLTFG